MQPIKSNTKTNTCGEPIGSNCVTWQGGTNDCFNLCKTSNITEVVEQLMDVACNTQDTIDVSTLDLGCLYPATITVGTCPSGLLFIPDTSAPNGVGYCQDCCPEFISIIAPTVTTIPNPAPRPTTLLQILQLMIDKIPCCDPCSKGLNPGT